MKPYLCHPTFRARFQPTVSAYQTQPFNKPKVNPEARINRPATNVIRNVNGYQIQIAIPGVPKEQVKIQVVENELIISANQPEKANEDRFVRKEFDFSGFNRRFTLHQNADTDNMKATFEQGVLNINIPDREPEMKKIEIQ